MDGLKRVVGGYLLLMAAVVGIFSVVEPLIHDSTEAALYSPAWHTINWFTGLAVLLGIGFAFARKRALGNPAADGAVTWGVLSANLLFYGFVGVGLMYFWNWFYTLNEAYTVLGGAEPGLAWKTTDVAFPLLAGVLGATLLRDRG